MDLEKEETNKKLYETEKCIQNLSRLLEISRQNEMTFFDNPESLPFEQLYNIHSDVLYNYTKTLHSIDISIDAVTNMISLTNSNNIVLTPKQFMENEAKRIIHNYFKNDPIYTDDPKNSKIMGVNSKKISLLNPGDLVCGKVKGDYFKLLIAYECVKPLYNFIDPSDNSEDPKMIQLTKENWIAIPKFIPKNPRARYEFPKNARVLALVDTDEKTSSFMFANACVLLRPCERNIAENRGYILSFDDGTQGIVAEQFVIGHF